MNHKQTIKKPNNSNKLLIIILVASLVISISCISAYLLSKKSTADSCEVPAGTSSSSETAASEGSASSGSSSVKDEKAPKASKGSSKESSSSNDSKKSSNGKTWVPAEYKTVTHQGEAYTVKILICDECGATFDTDSQWQAHKKAYGG